MILKNLLSPLLGLLKQYRLLIGCCALFIFLISYWLWLDFKQFTQQPIHFKESRTITIANGTSLNGLARKLEKEGVIKHRLYLKILAKLNPEYKKLKMGEYQLQESMTPGQLLSLLSKGQVIQYPFTIVEGQTAYEIFNHLKKEERLRPLKNTKTDELLKLLKIKATNLEGWLFPETYNFSKGETALSVIKRASQSMQQVLEEEWMFRDEGLPYRSSYEALIMASIIEKETGIASERAQIAGVFVRRLQKRMRLQTDPTVIYGIGPDFNGDITRKDLKKPTPYNTYVIRGLPPTPIAMPSREAINAALHPIKDETLYFVADGSGGHYFSKTLSEHQKAVRRMLKRR